MDRDDDGFVCPHCGEEVAAGAKACPHCGSDERTGWSDDADKWAADIPAGYSEDDDFDYEEFIRREFPDREGPARWLRRLLLVALVAVLVLVLVLALAGR